MRILGVITIVVIAVFAAGGIDLVEDHAEDAGADSLELLEGLAEGAELGDAGFGDQDDAIHDRGEGDSVSDGENGRGVDQDQLEILVEAVEDLGHAAGGEQFGGVGGQATGGDDGEPGDAGVLDDAEEAIEGADEEPAEADAVGEAEFLVDGGAAHIGIDQDGFFLALGQDDGQVGGDGGLAFLGGGAGDEDAAQGAVDGGVGEVGAQAAEGFGDGGAGLGQADGFAFDDLVAGDDAQDGQVELLADLFGVLDGVVEGVDGEDETGGEEHAGQQGEQGVAGGFGADGFARDAGRLGDEDVGAGLGFGQADLFEVGDEVGVEAAVFGEAGFELELFGGAGFAGDGLGGVVDLFLHFLDLLGQAFLGGGVALGLEFADAVGEDDGQGVGDISGLEGVGVLDFDEQELGVADDLDADVGFEIVAGHGQAEFVDDALQDGAVDEHFGVGAGHGCAADHGGGVEATHGGGVADEQAGGGFVDGGGLDGDDVGGGAGEDAGHDDEPGPGPEQVGVFFDVEEGGGGVFGFELLHG